MNEQIDGNDKGGIIGEVDLAVIQKDTAGNQNDNIEDLGDKRRTGMELCHRIIGIAACVDELTVAVLKLCLFLFGVGKCLGDADAGNGRFQRRIDDRHRLARFGKRIGHLLAVDQRHNDQKRYNRKDDQRQRHGKRAEVHKRADDHNARDQQIFGTVVRKLGDLH